MGRFYYTSNREDRTSLDTEATNNIIKDIFIMLGIYSSYCKCSNNFVFRKYYNNITNSFVQNFVGKYHFYNQGIIFSRNLVFKDGEKTSCRRLKKLSYTHRARPIRIPRNAVQILKILFNYIFDNCELKDIFLTIILDRCTYYSLSSNNYPSDCIMGIFGYLYIFSRNIYNIQSYSTNYKFFSKEIESVMRNLIDKYNIQNNCVKRNQ